jgi:hypothetical protein
MKFLCVGYYDQERIDALSRSQLEAVKGECPPLMEELYASGKVFLVAGSDAEAKVMRRVGGEVTISDSVTGGGRESVGCVFLVEALDIADAVRVAALHPTTRIAAGEQLGFRIGIRSIQSIEERRLKN